MTQVAHPTLSAGIALATLLLIAVGRVPGVRLHRGVVAVVGAACLVAIGAVDVSSAWTLVDGPVLVLLFGLMLVQAALAEGGAYAWLARRTAGSGLGPRGFLVALVLVSGVLSALVLNDAVVVMLTPFVVQIARSAKLRPLPFLLALALAANAGSVATVTGNPQNVLVAVAAHVPYGVFVARLALPAALGLAAVALALLWRFRRELRGGSLRQAHVDAEPLRPARLALAAAVTAGMVAAFALGAPVAAGALVAGAALLVLWGREAPLLLRRVDVDLLVLFAGLFVVVGVLARSGVVDGWVRLAAHAGPWVVAGLTAGLSNVVSNVPAVLVLLPSVPPGAHPDGALLLAMASTFAGNLTLVGSVANLIVAEHARRSGEEVGFLTHARSGVPVTLVTLALGVAWLTLTG